MGVGGKVKNDHYPMCGAKNRQGNECRQPAMKNGRCHYHGGQSLSGEEHGRYLHGLYTKESKERRKVFADLMRQSRQFVEEITAD